MIIRGPIARDALKKLAQERFGDMMKAVVDIGAGIMAVGGELHADEEQVLLEQGSDQRDLWGVNLYPDETSEAWVEFDSMINIRPAQGNRSRGVDDETMREKIRAAVSILVPS